MPHLGCNGLNPICDLSDSSNPQCVCSGSGSGATICDINTSTRCINNFNPFVKGLGTVTAPVGGKCACGVARSECDTVTQPKCLLKTGGTPTPGDEDTDTTCRVSNLLIYIVLYHVSFRK